MKIAIVSGGGHEVGVPSSAASLLVAKASGKSRCKSYTRNLDIFLYFLLSR